jgi:hypothetical protein
MPELIPPRSDRKWHNAPERTHCVDCHRATGRIGHFYSVEDAVWRLSGLSTIGGVLCLDCLEKRIGRPLAVEDFKPTFSEENRRAWGGQDRMLPRAWPRHLQRRGEALTGQRSPGT